MERPLLLLRAERALLHTLLDVLYVKLASIILLFFLQNNKYCYMGIGGHSELIPIDQLFQTILSEYLLQIIHFCRLLIDFHNYLY